MQLTYRTCVEMLGGRDRKKLAGNTYLVRMDDGSVVVLFHSTPILRYRADDTCVVSSGGYRTVTTKARLNDYGPVLLWAKKGAWWWGLDGMEMQFRDGVIYDLYPDGSVKGISETGVMSADPEERALVEAFLRGECPAGVVTDWRKERGLIPV